MLCGSRTFLNIPTLTYKEITKKCARVDELEAKVKELEAQLNAKEEVQAVSYDGILGIIRNWFRNVFGTVAVEKGNLMILPLRCAKTLYFK